ncbi:hypothetical protein A0H81_02026 [Grifola frondosa]|uniref:C2H2-type domain-containing protein n=1 Tax=Grifola frondosa TaxID=5627 RepID=A0A1C7MNM6_GRIFR|nr:hypothetical protein A0H81_02026 [Grifola frondosa]
MSDNSESVPMGEEGLSLFSLSEVAASAQPILVVRDPSLERSFTPGSFNGPSSLTTGGGGSVGGGSKVHSALKHRRLSSTGQTRRRMSDAREATSRPSPVTLQTAAAALSSLATLSLSGTPPPQSVPQMSTSFSSASGLANAMSSMPLQITPNSTKQESKDDEVILNDSAAPAQGKTAINGAGISVTKTGKKMGTIFKCESCSKVYRHPSCLIKHRWEHSPHWREASKFLLSKHQQVQLLEAAAILSHLSPATGGTSLPEDRSLWPSYLSGGLLPPPDSANIIREPVKHKPRSSSVSLEPHISFPTSSSVPAQSLLSSTGRSPSAGPRMHDYSIPGAGGVTHVRPGVLGIPIGSSVDGLPSKDLAAQRTAPVPVPMPNNNRSMDHTSYREPDGGGYSFVSGASETWSSPVSVSFAQSSFRSSSVSASVSALGQSLTDDTGGWSLPRSSVRSGSRSRSGSMSESDYVDVDGDEDVTGQRFGFTTRRWKMDDASARGAVAREEKIEEEWDGMEMEMEM